MELTSLGNQYKSFCTTETPFLKTESSDDVILVSWLAVLLCIGCIIGCTIIQSIRRLGLEEAAVHRPTKSSVGGWNLTIHQLK